ncbi:MAG: hypothetical protein II949_14440 [Prevotella sp.]|nr:hypothetical protein [Prevotella sp.]
MLTVLHIHPKDVPMTTRYLSLLSDAMRHHVRSITCDEKADFQRLCAEFRPDIVHQHGAAPFSLPSTVRRVVSPNGSTAVATDGMGYYAIVARSKIEAQRLQLPRTEVILNPLITKTTTFDETAEKMVRVYKRVMDSNPLPLMDEDTRRLLAAVLKVGILGDQRWLTTPLALDVQYAPAALRLIQIYSEFEGVSAIADEGLRILGISAPRREAVDCYLPEGFTPPTSMRGRTVVDMLNDVSQNGLSLLRLTDLSRALHDEHLNESELLLQLEQNNLTPLFKSIIQLLSEQLLLDEGFMPCAPADNRQTQNLRTLLTNHLRI